MLGYEREELRDDVELGVAERGAHGSGIPHIRGELAHALRQRSGAPTRD